MPKFRLALHHAVDLYHPSGHQDSMTVEPGQVIEVPGELVTTRPATKDGARQEPIPADAYVVLNVDVNGDDEERTWPTAVWELVEDKPAAKSAAPAKENS